jgi:hypothetical protein
MIRDIDSGSRVRIFFLSRSPVPDPRSRGQQSASISTSFFISTNGNICFNIGRRSSLKRLTAGHSMHLPPCCCLKTDFCFSGKTKGSDDSDMEDGEVSDSDSESGTIFMSLQIIQLYFFLNKWLFLCTLVSEQLVTRF